MGTRSLGRGRRDNDATTNVATTPGGRDDRGRISAAILSIILVVVRVAARRRGGVTVMKVFVARCLLASIRGFTLSASK